MRTLVLVGCVTCAACAPIDRSREIGYFAPGLGEATIECTVQADGRVADCLVLTEQPEGRGLGQAAVDGAARAQLNTEQSRAGQKVRFTSRFRLDPE